MSKKIKNPTEDPTEDYAFIHTEYRHKHFASFNLKVERVVYSQNSEIQRIDIFDTPQFGRVFTLDGLVMVTEKDEWMYHEMLVHVPMFSHPSPEKVLIIGGGDGGSLREVLKHKTVKEAVMVEVDGQVVEAAKKYLPFTSCAMEDPKAKIIIEEGGEFVKKNPGSFDVIIIDSTDPTKGAGGVLFTEEFYTNCKKALKDGGVLSAETEDYLYDYPFFKMAVTRLSSTFPVTKLYWGAVTSYPTGMWTYTFASIKTDPIENLREKDARQISDQLKYYNAEIHKASFILPNFLRKMVGGNQQG